MGGFEDMLRGGHPNSLGRTEEVVDAVLADRSRLDELFACYASTDEVVRLRTSSAMKRVTTAEPDWVLPYVDRLQHEIAAIDQASTQWTLAILFDLLRDRLSSQQRRRAIAIMQRNLEQSTDWIVLNTTMQTLGRWSTGDADLGDWLLPRARRLADDPRRSVAKNGRALVELLS